MNTQPKYGYALGAISMLLIVGACGTEPSLLPPTVQMFSAAPSTIALGDSSRLTWSVSGADSVFLSPDIGAVKGPSRWVHPANNTAYRLVATNRAGADTAYLTVTVTRPAPPQIANFGPSATTIVTGAAAVLSWNTTGADTVRIDQGIGVVRGNMLQVQPTATTTYTLTAVNAGGDASASVVVTVTAAGAPPPDPEMFMARMVGGGGILLSWNAVPLASSYAIEWSSNISPTLVLLATVSGSTYYADGGAVTANNIYTYRLKAINAAGASTGVMASSLAAPQPPEGPPPIVITPTSPVTVARGGMVTFTASQAVSWFILDGLGGGTITSAGLYTAPTGGGTFRVAALGSVTNTATVVVP